ncbi:MAG: M20/M25/M40 family metallo-hydrolase [Bryobacteraceae bacterium]|nr:M20/M25/M40 family metallo-hydrolase [Bryobacteraceae bacterium]
MLESIERTLWQLVAINSENPDLVPGAPGEREAAEFVAEEMRGIGCEVTLVGGDRPSVIATLKGMGGGRSLMFNGHLDTVAGHAEVERKIEGDLLTGRGSYDMKASIVAAMFAMKELAANRPKGDVVLTAVADEEVASQGTQEVLRHIRTDAAICAEPTALKTCVAHKGFVWIEVELHGKAAHGSRFDEGIDANLKMGRFLAKLDEFEQELRARTPHKWVGPPSLHAATIHGGTGWSTYSDKCVLQIERRTIPGETAEQALAEIQALAPDAAKIALAREPFETREDAGLVQAVQRAGGGELCGDTPWMDAALLSSAGIETVVIGPWGGGAHAAYEWVFIPSVYDLKDIFVRTAHDYCS